jgi:hypothetical protein
MKLTAEQIQKVSDYVVSFDIKWYELQVEFTDHMVNSMEEIWENNPELSFEDVLLQAKISFGPLGFKGIEKQRIEILRREIKRKQKRIVLEYLKFPKIAGSLFLVYLAYQGYYFFENPSGYILGLYLSSLIPFILYGTYMYLKNRDLSGKQFLSINKFDVFWGYSFFQIGMSLSGYFKEEINQNSIVLLLFCVLWAIGLLFVFTGIHLYQKTIQRVKMQYQLN